MPPLDDYEGCTGQEPVSVIFKEFLRHYAPIYCTTKTEAFLRENIPSVVVVSIISSSSLI